MHDSTGKFINYRLVILIVRFKIFVSLFYFSNIQNFKYFKPKEYPKKVNVNVTLKQK